jgi:hypothetical protein
MSAVGTKGVYRAYGTHRRQKTVPPAESWWLQEYRRYAADSNLGLTQATGSSDIRLEE